MKTHCLIFLAIGDLVSPIELPFPDKCGGRTNPPLRTKDISVLDLLGNRAVGPGAPVSLVPRATRDVYSYVGRQLTNVLTF
jgi:hypothetical protein